MKKFVIPFVGLVMVMVFCFTACNLDVGNFTGNPSERFSQINGEGLASELIIEEADIVKVYDDFIIKKHSLGISIIHTNLGRLSKVAEFSHSEGIQGDLIISNNRLIAINIREEKIIENEKVVYKDYNTDIYIFDLSNLTTTSYSFPIIRTLNLKGEYRTAKVFNDKLYVATTYLSKEKRMQDGQISYDNNGTIREIRDMESMSKLSDIFSAFVVTPIMDSEQESTAVGCYADLFELAIYPTGIYPIFYLGKDYNMIVKLSVDDLSFQNSIADFNYKINNRYCINDNGENIFVVTTNLTYGSRLTIYDSLFNKVGRVDNIAPDENLKAVRYSKNFAYIVTFRIIDPVFKIDISNVESPSIVDELKITGYSTYLHMIDEMDIAIGIGFEGSGFFEKKISLFNVAGDEIDEIDSIETSMLMMSFGYFDPRCVYVDRERNYLFLIGAGVDWDTDALIYSNDKNFYSNDISLFLNILILEYSKTGITIKKVISEDLGEELDYLLDTTFLKMLVEGRSLTIGDFLYFVGNNRINSYAMNNDFALVDTLAIKS